MNGIIHLPDNPTPQEVKEVEGQIINTICRFITENKERLQVIGKRK